MKIKIKQNKNSSVKRISCFVISVLVLLISISVPVFAYTDTSTNGIDFTNQPIPQLTSYSTQLPTLGLFVFNANNRDIKVGSDTAADCYCFLTSNKTLIVCSASSSGHGYWILPDGASGGNRTTSFNSNTSLYYYSVTAFRNYTLSNVSVPEFADTDTGLSAVRDWINNPPAVIDPHPVSLIVPAGNAVYIDVTGISTVHASLSMTSEVAHPQSWVSNQYYGWASTYPSSIAGNPTGSTPIPWSGYGDKTIFNRYKSFTWSLTSVGGSNYLFICNPYASIDEYDQSFNPTIYINLDSALGYKNYQLTGGISSDGTIGQQSDGITASGTYNEDTQTWDTTNDETGLPWSPSEGGGNLITTNSINDWLKTIATQISNFFAGAIGAVTTLVNAGSSFINSLSSLYSWLPAPVYAVLTSALILVITIGVIKVFI